MKILGFQPESYIDWEDGLASVIYTGGCNFACSFCHAKRLTEACESLSQEDILKKLVARKRFLNRVVISGGEPTIHKDLPEFITKLKELDFLIKLDTNGSNPDMLESLLWQGNVDYLAMDIKAPKELYSLITCAEVNLDDIDRSIRLARQFKGYEFRTTIGPFVEKEKLRWITPEEVGRMAQQVIETTDNKISPSKWYLQRFEARTTEDMINSEFGKENLAREYHRTPNEVMNLSLAELKKYFPNATIR